MTDYIGRNKYFLIPWLAVLLGLLPILLSFSKAEIHLYTNQWQNEGADYFFRYITFFGDGIAIVILVIVYLFISFRHSIILAVSGIITSLIAQLLKRLVFSEIVRPIKYFEGIANLHLVEGVNMHSYFSFPSGHSATVFCLALCMASFTQYKIVKFVLFCAAIIVAYSRIYLSQHFLLDTYAGSIIGVFSAIVTIIFFEKRQATWLNYALFKNSLVLKSK